MKRSTQDGGRAEFDESSAQQLGRLMEEINILRLEGNLFCPDPREAKRRTVPFSLDELADRSVIIEPNPNYGQPSVLAYRVLQAVFQKSTEEGYPYPSTIAFHQRELARMVDRKWAGSKLAKEIYNAIMQLRSTHIHCSLYNKDSKKWAVANFNVFSSAYFAGTEQSLHACVVELDQRIVDSLRRRHTAFFNLRRLAELDIVGMMMYKRVFFHLSNLYGPRTSRDALRFEKDYKAICKEWLGGLKVHKYKAQIERDQLARHLEALKRTRLIRRCDIERRADGQGFKLVFYPGPGFFADYHAYYLERRRPQRRLRQTADVLDVQQPLEAVAHFHRLCGHEHNTFQEKEIAYAARLLAQHPVAEVRDLIDFAVKEARTTNFRMRFFGALSSYWEPWLHHRQQQEARAKRREAIRGCPYCDDQGLLLVKDRAGSFAAAVCPHAIGKISDLEENRGLRRV